MNSMQLMMGIWCDSRDAWLVAGTIAKVLTLGMVLVFYEIVMIFSHSVPTDEHLNFAASLMSSDGLNF